MIENGFWQRAGSLRSHRFLSVLSWSVNACLFSDTTYLLVFFFLKKKKDKDSFVGMLFQDSFKGGTDNWAVYDASGSFQRTEKHYVP
jgi:hypothetical protein